MKTTTKEVFESDNWVIISIMQGYNNKVRIDAKRRFRIPDTDHFFSEWCTEKYANSLALENYGKNIFDFNCMKY